MAAESDDLTFYYAPHSRAATVAWMLEELGAPHKLEIFNLQKGDHKSASYLAINPMGKVPAIKHRGTVVTESAAICCYLADEFSQAGLAPAIGDPARGAYLRWLFFSPSCIEPVMADRAFDRPLLNPSTVGHGDFDTVMSVLTDAVSQGDYLLGERFTAADVVVGSAVRYGLMFGIFPKKPEFEAYAGRLAARPALQRSMARDQELAAAQQS
ncbi:MAG: glutathione S-transferase family protein [Rhodomicrobiaceae bacterium]